MPLQWGLPPLPALIHVVRSLSLLKDESPSGQRPSESQSCEPGHPGLCSPTHTKCQMLQSQEQLQAIPDQTADPQHTSKSRGSALSHPALVWFSPQPSKTDTAWQGRYYQVHFTSEQHGRSESLGDGPEITRPAWDSNPGHLSLGLWSGSTRHPPFLVLSCLETR